MARAYTAPAPAYTQPAVATDAVSLATASTVIEIDELDMNQATATTVANVSMSVLRYSGAFSVASGGSSGTVAKHLSGDSATGVTALYNNTVQASAGTAVTMYADAINIINGWQKLPVPEDLGPSLFLKLSAWRLRCRPDAERVRSLDDQHPSGHHRTDPFVSLISRPAENRMSPGGSAPSICQ